jgi:hypothetical protein
MVRWIRSEGESSIAERTNLRRGPSWCATVALAAVVALAPVGATTAFGFGDGTPDTDPPAEESVCDGLSGRAWGLCVAYCEAQDCPGSEHPSCEVLRDKVFGVLGVDTFPCDGGGDPGIG